MKFIGKGYFIQQNPAVYLQMRGNLPGLPSSMAGKLPDLTLEQPPQLQRACLLELPLLLGSNRHPDCSDIYSSSSHLGVIELCKLSLEIIELLLFLIHPSASQ